MAYESVAQILDSIDETRERLVARAAQLSAEEEVQQSASGGWTVAEIIEHVATVEEQIVKLTNMMLMKAEADGGRASDDLRIAPVSLDHLVERGWDEKFQAPESARPRGGVGVADSIAKMRSSRAALRALRPRLEAADLSSANYPHPVFGPLNLYEWLLVLGAHEDRHLRQVESLLQSA